jgi:3-hydroxybutyryl-CoA dehydrogenase
MPQFQSAAVLGTGMMGPGLAFTLAMGGVRTTIVSRSAERAADALERARALGSLLAANQLATTAQTEAASALLSASSDFETSIGNAGLVLESHPENLELKKQLFARMDAIAPPETVLASNTSGLSITAIAERCRHPERVLTAHFWNPAHLVPLVEIVRGAHTSDAALERVRSLLIACGKTPVVVKKDRPGQLGNRMQMALFREAVNIVAEGIADAEAVDSVVKNGLGIRMPAYGIFEHIDITGVDLGTSVVDYVVPDLYNEPRAPELMREMVRRGDLGIRTGKGFYDWSVKSADEVKAARDAFLVEVLRYRRKA